MLRTCRIIFVMFIALLGVAAVHAQAEDETQDITNTKISWPAIPANSHEPVTGPLQLLTTPADRAMALDLLSRVRQNYDFYVQHGPAFDIKVSFNATGQSQHEGYGTMEQIWLDGEHFKWSAQMAGSTSGRIVYPGRRQWVDGPSAIPLRVQMVRSAIFWPVPNIKPRAELRMQSVNFGGSAVNCVLASGRIPNPPAGRHWVESEYCVDARTGLLREWSAAPGIYAIYDYKNAIQFHGHTIASEITFYENEVPVLQIHVDSIGDAAGVSPDDFRPSTPTPTRPVVPGNGGPARLAIFSRGDEGSGPMAIQPVIVHAALAPGGKIIEAEVITPVDAATAERALEAAKARCQCVTFGNMQMEVLINVKILVPKN
jgi:hypothetical protein